MVIGLSGPSDPMENLMTLSVWSLFWIILVAAHPVLGHLWGVLNPLIALGRLVERRSDDGAAVPRLTFPPALAYVPAVLLFFAFAWFQLVDPAPDDPRRLTYAVLAYLGLSAVAMACSARATGCPGAILRGDVRLARSACAA